MIYALRTFSLFSNPSPPPSINEEILATYGSTFGYISVRILQFILSRDCFSWIGRGSVQLKSLYANDYKYWSKINDSIYLGAMPIRNWDHHTILPETGIGAVLSINKKYEFTPQLFADPVQPDLWEHHQINFLRISNPDLQPLSVENIALAVDYVAKQVDQQRAVYIHCIGGRGRSAIVAICCLVKIFGYSLPDAFNHVKACRPQILLSKEQVQCIFDWYEEKILKQE